MKHKELILKASKELNEHLYENINISLLAKRIGCNWKTARGVVDLLVNKLKCLNIQNLPKGWENWEEDIVNWECVYDGDLDLVKYVRRKEVFGEVNQ